MTLSERGGYNWSYRWDGLAEAGYLYLNDYSHVEVCKTIELPGGLNLDLDHQGGIVGVELLA